MKKIFFCVLIFCFFSPLFSFAQTQPSVNYSTTSIRETSVIISGQVSPVSGFGYGFTILLGSNPSLLLNPIPVFLDINGYFEVEVTNLYGNTTYYYKLVYGPMGTSMGPTKSFKTSASTFIINHKNITQTNATLFGNVSPGHSDFIIKYGITKQLELGYFRPKVEGGVFEEEFPSDFAPETTVFYRAVDPLFPLIFYSPLKSFKTRDEMINFDFRNVTPYSVSIFGNIAPAAPPIKVLISSSGLLGFEAEKNPNIVNGTWQADFDNLRPETEYYVRISKRDDNSFTYLIKKFTTFSANIDLQFFNITENSLMVSGRIPVGIDSVLICFANTEATLQSAPDCGSGPVFTVSGSEFFEEKIENLASNTEYFFNLRDASGTTNLSKTFTVSTFGPAGPAFVGNNLTPLDGPKSLVPCDGLNCDFYALLKLVDNVINFLLKTIALPLFAIIFAYIGWLLMSSSGDSGKRSKAKKIFFNAVVGFIIALAAFLIVKVILSSLGYAGINYLDF